MSCKKGIPNLLVLVCLFAFLIGGIPGGAQVLKKISVGYAASAGAFPVVAPRSVAKIHFDTAETKVVHIAAAALSSDIKLITGIAPKLSATRAFSGYPIIIGTVGKSSQIDNLVKAGKLDVSAVQHKWETFSISIVDKPFGTVGKALVVAGSDARGTAFGVFELSAILGVSPLYWWADVTPEHHNALYLSGTSAIVGPPSVKYRGIFINDEDWGLQPWAAKTFEPETGDIGPKTYAKVFELLLRLKANLIWPAMHPSTKAFYSYPGNKLVAADYAIIVGSSHAEPMLRNNVGEWNTKTMGEFNYLTNKATVSKYWEERVKESSKNDAIYSLGMRGIHDSGIEGVKSAKEAVPLIEKIFSDQRQLLTTNLGKDITAIPQVFTAYKEVLEIYDNGPKLPEDVTLVWPDDNYGYIQRLNNTSEQNRAGGSGVYYHASYWGRPHDYLWLSSTHPALIRSEMMKAYDTKANRLWVLNVGDIKPLEYNIQFFMDMAYDVKPFRNSSYPQQHLRNWATNIFGAKHGGTLGNMLWKYYDLAFERRPEFMGWSQTEPTTKTRYTDYNHFYFGDQAQQRINKYDALARQAKKLRSQLPRAKDDAYFQLVYYPIIGATYMNLKFLYRDKSYLYALQNRLSAYDYAKWSNQAYDSIARATSYYNNELSSGKWKHMMSMQPRELPVYDTPALVPVMIDRSANWNIAPEGFVKPDSLKGGRDFELPLFSNGAKKPCFIDVFLSDDKEVSWAASSSADWILLNRYAGALQPVAGKNECRVYVSINWGKLAGTKVQEATITFRAMGSTRTVRVKAIPTPTGYAGFKGFVEQNGYVSIYASNYTHQFNNNLAKWQLVDGLGHTGKSMQAMRLLGGSASTTTDAKKQATLEYEFITTSTLPTSLQVFTLPAHPLTNTDSMRYAISVDDFPAMVVNHQTFSRSEEWKQNVLSNSAIRKFALPLLKAGKHTLRLHMVDPGVTVDRFVIDCGGLRKGYGVIAETKL